MQSWNRVFGLVVPWMIVACGSDRSSASGVDNGPPVGGQSSTAASGGSNPNAATGMGGTTSAATGMGGTTSATTGTGGTTSATTGIGGATSTTDATSFGGANAVASAGTSSSAAGTASGSAQTVDPNATAETKALFSNLQAITRVGWNGVLFGMQDALDTGFFALLGNGTIDWSAGDGLKSDVRTLTGKGPAIVGYDVADIVGDWWDPSEPNFEQYKTTNKDSIRSRMQQQRSRGGINTLSWHMANYGASGHASFDAPPRELWRIAPPDACTQLQGQGHSVPNCGAAFSVFQSRIGEFADWVLSVKDAAGRPIPMIFRPFHENGGDWFWWGAGGAPDPRYQATLRAIWSWMVNYMTNVKGVHQILWTISPNGGAPWGAMSTSTYLSYTPGLDLLDVLGYDFYFEDLSLTIEAPATADIAMIVALARKNTKVAAWTEGGYSTTGYQQFIVTDTPGVRTTLIANPPECQQGRAIYRLWTEKVFGPLIATGGVAYYHAWANRPNPDGSTVFGPVPGTCTGDDFRAAWQAHQALLEGEGQNGVVFDYYKTP